MRRRSNFQLSDMSETIYPDGGDAQWGHERDEFGMALPYYIRSDVFYEGKWQEYMRGLEQGEKAMQARAMKLYGVDLSGPPAPVNKPKRVLWNEGEPSSEAVRPVRPVRRRTPLPHKG